MTKRILIIEDEKPLAEEWQRTLQAKGYDVKIWSEVSEVLSGLDQLDFDLVILDVILPTFDLKDQSITPETLDYGRTAGVWLCKRLKEVKPDIPIIACTVVRDPDILEQIREAGINLILRKPIETGDIVTYVRRFLEDKEQKIDE